MISNGWRQEALAAATAVDLSAVAAPSAVTVAAGYDPVELDVSDFDLTLYGCDFTQATPGVTWQWVNATASTDSAAGTVGTIAPNTHIIPLIGTWVANDKLVLTLNLTYNGITITKTAAVTVTFTI